MHQGDRVGRRHPPQLPRRPLAGPVNAGGPVGWVREIVLDCPDPWELAEFWAWLLGVQIPWRVYRDPAGHPFCLVVR
jgi:hypothetical protein